MPLPVGPRHSLSCLSLVRPMAADRPDNSESHADVIAILKGEGFAYSARKKTANMTDLRTLARKPNITYRSDSDREDLSTGGAMRVEVSEEM